MLLLKDQLTTLIAAPMGGNHGIGRHHIDTVNIRLDRHRLKGPTTRDRVTISVKTNRLILIDLRRLRDTGIKRTFGQGQRPDFIPFKTLTHRFRFTGLAVLELT